MRITKTLCITIGDQMRCHLIKILALDATYTQRGDRSKLLERYNRAVHKMTEQGE